MNDDFYIGWQSKAPPPFSRTVRQITTAVFALVLLGALGLAAAQRLIGGAFFEWGHVQEFTGVLRSDPCPHLILHREATNATTGWFAAPLVAPFKFGVQRNDIAAFEGQSVKLKATRIHRDSQLMLELVPNSIELDLPASHPEVPRFAAISLGRSTFRGEIVDSKCWMGVMNPGVLTPHRACAVRCISGGVPPMLLVRRQDSPPLNLLLVSLEDQPVNDQVLDFVAEPVEITGEVVRQGELLTFRVDPANFRRLSR